LSEENVPEEQVIEEGKEEFDPLRKIKGVDEKLAAVLRDSVTSQLKASP